MKNPDVVPIRSVSELSKEQYKRRRRRSGRVSFLAGTFGVLLVAIGLFVFLWDFWVKEIFTPAERVDLPNFVGKSYQSLANDPTLTSLYNFNFIFVVNTDTDPGVILDQSPNPGRSMMVTPDRIKVSLIVSSGDTMSRVPDVINMDYRVASATLRQAGFYVEIANEISESYTKDCVIRCYPAVGEEASTASTVYLWVSSGPSVTYVSMPNLIGLSEGVAITQLENNALSYGGSEYVTSELPAGTVINQSYDAFTQIEEHTKVILRVSTGPEEG